MHHHNLQGKECLSKLCEGFYSTGFSFLKIIFDTVEGLTARLSSPVTICVNRGYAHLFASLQIF
jgi:hypothetical protein